MNQPPITLINNWLNPTKSIKLFEDLWSSINWQNEAIKMFGKSITVPRKIAWFGDDGITYTYSGISHKPSPWVAPLFKLKEKLLDEHNLTFNSVLCNLYINGNDYMGWHQDNEPSLGENPIIASISLGESRRFLLRNNVSLEKHEVMLDSGSLLIMNQECQKNFQHCLPKMRRITDARINLTFRKIFT